ncbi:hypothetical protein ACIBQ6_11330 [Nonomuraea sp. NPDC049655]|uniref:hypothetical protein n=1 Tax=Nonomuraea sp. NPDC049655 TaxID=3364355 RepID=UPI0037A5937B
MPGFHHLCVLYAGFRRRMADHVTRDQQVGRIPATLAPSDTALALVALAEGLAAYVLTGVTSATTAREQVLTAVAGLHR